MLAFSVKQLPKTIMEAIISTLELESYHTSSSNPPVSPMAAYQVEATIN